MHESNKVSGLMVENKDDTVIVCQNKKYYELPKKECMLAVQLEEDIDTIDCSTPTILVQFLDKWVHEEVAKNPWTPSQ